MTVKLPEVTVNGMEVTVRMGDKTRIFYDAPWMFGGLNKEDEKALFQSAVIRACVDMKRKDAHPSKWRVSNGES